MDLHTQSTSTLARLEEIDITPNFEVTAEFFAGIYIEQGYERFAGSPMVSLIQQIRFLMQTDPDAVQRIIDNLSRRYHA